jgi:hypothetical protein
MPSSSLVKFVNEVNGGSRGRLHWGRSDIDGAPFRGDAPPTGTEEELEARLTRVHDPKNRTFDTTEPTDNAAYLTVMDKIVNGWAQCLHRFHRHCVEKTRDANGVMKTRMKVLVYIEWVEYYMEDGKPNLSQRPYLGKSNANG